MRSFLLLVCALSFALAGCGIGKTCQPDTNQLAGAFCVPDGGAAQNQALSLEIVEACGGCARSASSCSVAVSGNTITLSLDGEACTLPPGTACPAVCGVSRFTCAVGPLDAGTYTVKANGPPSQTLVVGATGAASCTGATF